MSGMAPKSHLVQCSPVKCNEKPWDFWIHEIGHSSPIRDEDYIGAFLDTNIKGGNSFRRQNESNIVKHASVQKSVYKRGSVNKLKHNMMSLHGMYPNLDPLNVAVCHMCGMSAKCSAAQRHLTEFHSNTEPILPPPPPAPTVKLKPQPKAKNRKETFQIPAVLPEPHISTPTIESKQKTAPLPRIILSQQDLKPFPELEVSHTKLSSQNEMKISVDGNDLPVVSIQDNTDLPLGDNLTDDIIEIMNSEGIQSIEDLSEADPNAWKNIMQDFNAIQEMTLQSTMLPDSINAHDLYNNSSGTMVQMTGASYAISSEDGSIQFTQPVSLTTLPTVDTTSVNTLQTQMPVMVNTPPVKPARTKSTKSRSKYVIREYDPNKHCGVIITDTNKPCTRSLTCKAHTLSLRRTVEGRTKPFDILLAEHRAAREASSSASQAPAQTTPVVTTSATVTAVSTTAVSISIPSPMLVTTPLDINPFESLDTDQQVGDLYSTLMSTASDGTTMLPDSSNLTSLLSHALPPDRFLLTEESELNASVPVLSIASPLSPSAMGSTLNNLVQEQPVPVLENEDELDTLLPVIPSDICWYPTNPRPLSICTFNACHMGGSIMIGKKMATVRNNFKTALARTHSNKVTPTGSNFYNFSQNTLSSLSKTANVSNVAKSTKPEVRKLIMSCSAFKGSSSKSDQSYDLNFCSSNVRQNGHLFTSKRPVLDDFEDSDSKHVKTNSQHNILRNSVKVAKPMMSQNDVLELSFMFDPLMADEKC